MPPDPQAPETSRHEDPAGQTVSFGFAIPDGRPGSGLTLMIGPDWGNKLRSIQSLARVGTEETESGPVLRTIYMPPMAELADRQAPKEPKGAVYKFKCALDPKTKHQLMFDALAEVWSNDDYKKQFNLWLGELLPGFGWSLQQPRSTESSFELWSQYWRMPPGVMEEGGALPIFYTLLHLIDVAEEQVLIEGQQVAGMLAIDRPEEFLSDFSLEKLAGIVSEITKDRQVAIATQAGNLLRWQDYINGARILVFGLDKDGQPKPSQRKAGNIYSSIIKTSPKPGLQPNSQTDQPPPGDQSQALAVFKIDKQGRTIDAKIQVKSSQEDPPWLATQTSPEEEADQKIQRIYHEILNCDGLIIAENDNLQRAILQWFDANKTRPGSGAVGCYNAPAGIETKVLLAMAADLNMDKVAAVYATNQSLTKDPAADKAVFCEQFGQKTWLFVTAPDVVTTKPDCGKCRDSCRCAPKGVSRIFGGKRKSLMEPKTQKALEPTMRKLIQYFN